MDFFTTENIGNLIELITRIVGVAAIVAAMTPNESDNKAVDFILNVINMFGGNFGNASNK